MPKPSGSTQTPRPHVRSSSSRTVAGGELAARHRRDGLRRDEPDAVELASAEQPGVEARDRRGRAVAVHRRDLGRPPRFAVHDRRSSIPAGSPSARRRSALPAESSPSRSTTRELLGPEADVEVERSTAQRPPRARTSPASGRRSGGRARRRCGRRRARARHDPCPAPTTAARRRAAGTCAPSRAAPPPAAARAARRAPPGG